MKKKFFSAALAAAMVVTSVFSTTSVAGAAENETAVPYGKVTVEQKDNTVTIGNDAIKRTFSTADKKLSTTEIVNKRTGGEGTTFTPQEGSEEFVVKTTKEQKGSITLEAINRDGWTATADSYQNASGDSDGPASNLLDGRTESIWHSNYGGGTGQGDQDYPHNVVITFGKDVTFQSFSYTPRKEGENTNGNIKGYKLYASTAENKLDYESEDWGEPIAEGEFEYNGTNPIYVNLKEACTAKQIKFVATSSNNGERFAGGAEFNLHADKAPVDTDDRAFETSDLELKDGNEAVKVEDTTATINGKEKTGKKVTFSFKPYTHKNVEYSIDEVIVMYEGDHFMRKFLEIDVPDDKMADAEIDYIDLESLKVAESDAQWTIPRGQGGVVQMEEFKANLGQPIYIQGMFFGCEFPAADTEIVNGTGFMRYYSGKTFSRLKEDNQLTTDDKYVTWQTVAGAARSTEQEVIQADFFEYIKSIATPSEFRTQYNSWFDNMMKISDEEFDYNFYTYGMQLYGNMPLIEPLEYKDVRVVKTFVTVIDTSGSVEEEKLRRFLEKTYQILKSGQKSEDRVNFHLIQCDALVQKDVKITSEKELEQVMEDLTLYGRGGTDFRPAFEYIEELRKNGELTNLNGMLYFTDGMGVYPRKKPEYPVAFIYDSEVLDEIPEVPAWAIRYLMDDI